MLLTASEHRIVVDLSSSTSLLACFPIQNANGSTIYCCRSISLGLSSTPQTCKTSSPEKPIVGDRRGSFNAQHFHYWRPTNSQLIYEEPLHVPKVTVWCGICSERVLLWRWDSIGEWSAMIRDFLANELAENEMEHYWFQQHGATCHSSRETMDFLKPFFPKRLISRNGQHTLRNCSKLHSKRRQTWWFWFEDWFLPNVILKKVIKQMFTGPN